MSWTELNTIAQTIFYIIASLAAIIGLPIWYRKVRNRSYFEAAKNILVCTYRLKYTIIANQSTLLLTSEYSDRKTKANETPEETDLLNSQSAYQKRFRFIIDEQNKLYENFVEGKAYFSEDIMQQVYHLFDLVQKFQTAIIFYHEWSLKKVDEPRIKIYQNIIQGMSNYGKNKGDSKGYLDDDNFKKDLYETVEEIEIEFKKLLKKYGK